MVKEIIIKISIDNGKIITATSERGFTEDLTDRLIIIGALQNLICLENDKFKNNVKHKNFSLVSKKEDGR